LGPFLSFKKISVINVTLGRYMQLNQLVFCVITKQQKIKENTLAYSRASATLIKLYAISLNSNKHAILVRQRETKDQECGGSACCMLE
jgi:hypothetical protein